MARRGKTQTLSAQTQASIRADILRGEWAPGENLQPAVLAARYTVSTTVVREALTVLSGEKLVLLVPNRGFCVPWLSLEELRDLTELRCAVEELGIRLAIERGEVEWESELIAIHYQLSRLPRRSLEDPTHINDDWAARHRAFHAKLLEACRFANVQDLARSLADATELYRRWAAPSDAAADRDVEGEHAAILEAVLAHDAPRAAALLRQHYSTTVQVLLEAGLVDSALQDSTADSEGGRR